jgi:hypothetical protein
MSKAAPQQLPIGVYGQDLKVIVDFICGLTAETDFSGWVLKGDDELAMGRMMLVSNGRHVTVDIRSDLAIKVYLSNDIEWLRWYKIQH